MQADDSSMPIMSDPSGTHVHNDNPAQPCARCVELEGMVLNLAVLLQRVMHAGTPVRKQAWEYLRVHGLEGSPLRITRDGQ